MVRRTVDANGRLPTQSCMIHCDGAAPLLTCAMCERNVGTNSVLTALRCFRDDRARDRENDDEVLVKP